MKEILLKTPRLTLRPCSMERLTEKTAQESDPHLKNAYREMADGILRHPDQWVWRTDWDIIRTEDGLVIGGAGFKKAPDASGSVEIGYGLHADFRGRGYMGETLSALCDWAFTHPEVLSVTAEVEPGNLTSERVLRRAGFQLVSNDGNSWFVIRRPDSMAE